MRLHAQVFVAEEDAGTLIRRIKQEKRTGSLQLHFNQGGLCKQVEWKEKVKDESRMEIRSCQRDT